MSQLSDIERTVLNNLQGGFPVQRRPFQVLGKEFELKPAKILETLRQLRRKNFLSRFGAVINSRALGGDSRLAAVSVPECRIEQVIDYVNTDPVVTHNYLRDHEINLWFVLSAETEAIIDQTLEKFESELGLRIYDLPKLTEFYIGLQFLFEEDGQIRTVNRENSVNSQDRSASALSEDERNLVAELDGGLPLELEPYKRLSENLGENVETVLEGLNRLLDQDRIRRIGCVPNHYALGIRGNGMTVFDVPDSEVDRVGRMLGERPEVTHCYERPRYRPEWPYNLFAMVHGKTREEALQRVEKLRNELDLEAYSHDVLFSLRKLKKTGLRLTSAK